jgi:hypothetical protein
VNGAAGGHAAQQGAGVAKGHAAIHAAGALLAQGFLVQVKMKLVPITNALQGRTVQGQLPQILYETFGFSHEFSFESNG